MPWVKIDDQFYVHEHRWEIGLEGMGLFVAMLCYCNHKLTDGFVTDAFVSANLPRPDRRGTMKALLKTGMLEKVDGGYRIAGYLKFQPSKAHVLNVRAERAVAGAKGARARSSKLPSNLPGKRAA